MSEGFEKDERISLFFKQLSDQEALHFQVMENALEYLEHNVAPFFSITVDNATKEKIEAPFLRNRELLAAGKLSIDNVLDCLAKTEFSEWNDIFVYVVSSLKMQREFMSSAATIHQHLKEIEDFMASLPEGLKYLHIIKSLPPVWEEHILVIDDDPLIVEFLGELLYHEGAVETAANGREGLLKIREKYFDVIISDIDMPLMDGIEFFDQASAYYPEIANRIIFFSGKPDPEHIDFFQKKNLRFLMKPASIRDIVRNVSEIMHRTSKVS